MLSKSDAKLLAALLLAINGRRVLYVVPNYIIGRDILNRLAYLSELTGPGRFRFYPNRLEVRHGIDGCIVIASIKHERDYDRLRGLRFDKQLRDESFDSSK